MRKSYILLLTILVSKILSAQICDGIQVVPIEDGVCNYTPFILAFEDNFDGNTLDLSKWQIQPWAQGTLSTDATQEYNSLDNVTVANGICKITAKHETVLRRAVNWLPDNEIMADGLPNLRTYYYTSSNIWTHTLFGYGKYEIRCKIPKGKGFWPSFWMYGNDANGVNNEIDVFEFWNENTLCIYDPNKLSKVHHMTVHYDGQQCGTDYTGPDFSQAFHTFTVVWDPYQIQWYVDGVLKRNSTKYYTIQGQTVDCDNVQAFGTYIIDKVFPKDPMNIISNLAIQRGTTQCGLLTIDNNPDGNTPFPSSLEIDYIRYYKQEPCTGAVNITNVTQLNLSNTLYNLIVGTTITVGGNVTIVNGKQLEMVARDEIRLTPGFSTTFTTGSPTYPKNSFVARIDPSICGSMKTDETTSDVTTDDTPNSLSYLTTDIALDKNFTIKAYPNPSNGILSIEFEANQLENYELYLFDQQGKVIYTLKPINSSKVDINLEEFGKGAYVLEILDNNNHNAYTNKIVFN